MNLSAKFKFRITIMYNSQFFFFLLFVSLVLTGQEPVGEPPLNLTGPSNWKYDAFSYADFGTGEEHSYFSELYQLNPKLRAELRGFYDSYRTSDVLDVSHRVRWYPTKKLYLFSGVGVQFQRNKGGLNLPIMPVRMLNGVGYDPNENISFEAVHDFNFNKNMGGLNASPNLFTLKGKYRF